MKKLIILLMMFGSVYSQCLGDMNGDGIKDILDIVNLVNDILDGDDVCEEPELFDCDGLTAVELWGAVYDIESTTALHIYGNSSNGWDGGLTGSIPPEIGCLTNLTVLNLSWNQLTGEIPSEIGNMTALNNMTLSNNQLAGEIPSEIGNLSNLFGLYLYENELSGEIPSEIGNLTNLLALKLSDNQLSGEIPQEVCDLIIIIENNLGFDFTWWDILLGNNLINTCE